VFRFVDGASHEEEVLLIWGISTKPTEIMEEFDRDPPLGSVLNGLPCEVLVRVADALRF
jgi:hypothetical protein